jgi:hypothetical protein
VKITPSLKVRRSAKLNAGDLFLFGGPGARWVGIAVHDGIEDNGLLLPIGPTLPGPMKFPTLLDDRGATVISFGSDYVVQLPTDPSAWSVEDPPVETSSLAITEESVFLRCNYAREPDQFSPCFVDLANGEICISGKGRGAAFTRPGGISAFTTQWSFLTAEDSPRKIIGHPFSAPKDV